MGRGQTKKYYRQMNPDYVEGTLTCLKPEFIRQNINIDFPLVLNIEPTNSCNLKCCCCPRDKTAKLQGTNFLSLKSFKKLVDEASQYPQLTMLNLHKDGEPLLHKQLPEMVLYAKEKNVAKTIHLNTNGTLLDTKRALKLLQSGIDDITISVDAAYPDTYFKLKGRNHLDHLNQKIEAFFNWRDQLGDKTFIRVKIMEYDLVSQDEIEEFHSRWKNIADQVQVTGIHSWSGAINDLNITDETSSNRYPCGLLWYMMAVNSNGKVSVCNVDWDYSGVIGDIHSSSLHKIWNNPTMRKIRCSHLESKWDFVPVCDKCVVWVSVGDMTGFFKNRNEFY